MIKDEYAQEYKALQDQHQGHHPTQNLEKKKQKVGGRCCTHTNKYRLWNM